jgi:hypothetical protein
MAIRLDPVQNIVNVGWGNIGYFIGILWAQTNQWSLTPDTETGQQLLPEDTDIFLGQIPCHWDMYLNFENPENAPSIQQLLLPFATVSANKDTTPAAPVGGPMFFNAAGYDTSRPLEEMPRTIQDKIPPDQILKTSNGWVMSPNSGSTAAVGDDIPLYLTDVFSEIFIRSFQIIIPSRFGQPQKEFDTGGDYWRLNLTALRNINSPLPNDVVPLTCWAGLYRPPPKERPGESESVYTETPAGTLEFVQTHGPLTEGTEWTIELPLGLPSDEKPIIITQVFEP